MRPPRTAVSTPAGSTPRVLPCSSTVTIAARGTFSLRPRCDDAHVGLWGTASRVVLGAPALARTDATRCRARRPQLNTACRPGHEGRPVTLPRRHAAREDPTCARRVQLARQHAGAAVGLRRRRLRRRRRARRWAASSRGCARRFAASTSALLARPLRSSSRRSTCRRRSPSRRPAGRSGAARDAELALHDAGCRREDHSGVEVEPDESISSARRPAPRARGARPRLRGRSLGAASAKCGADAGALDDHWSLVSTPRTARIAAVGMLTRREGRWFGSGNSRCRVRLGFMQRRVGPGRRLPAVEF